MPQPEPMPPKLKTILVVDDDEGMRDTLGAILKKNYRVKLAVTGEEALAVLKREDVDLMLLDVRLPGINGLEVLKIVKENYTLIEVIMISAINEVETAVQAMKHGAYHYEAKTLRGTRRYSSEVLLGPGDRIILDDDSVNSLESKIARLVPATVYSRMLAAKASVAA